MVLRLLSLSVVVLLGLSGCNRPENASARRASGTLALTSDDALAYAVNADLDRVEVVDLSKSQVVATVPVGDAPEQIIVTPDDTAFVANRGDRSLSVFSRGQWDDVERIAVGVEPVGLALSGDAKVLYVVNAAAVGNAERGSLMAIDTSARQVKWELDLPADPRGIVLLNDSKAVISLYRAGDVLEVDLGAQKITRSQTSGLYEAANKVEEQGFRDPFQPGLSTSAPRGLNQLVASPQGDRIYGTVTWSSEALLSTSGTKTVTGGGGSYGGGTGCGGGAVASPGIATFESGQLTALADSSQECFNTEAKDFPATRLTSNNGEPLQGPVALVLDPTGTWLFVANRESNNVAVVPTSRGSQNMSVDSFGMPLNGVTREVIKTDQGPSGLALSSDGRRLYVHNSFSHTVQKLESAGEGSNAIIQVQGASIPLATNDELQAAGFTNDVLRGRELFFSADNALMNNPSIGISCASCHLEGREDGHVWNFDEGPRQTPSLAGRMLSATAPFHWGGEHADFDAFLIHTVGERMGGSGLSATQTVQLLSFIDSMPLPDNPHNLGAPSDAQVRGEQVFQKAGCGTCHTGQTFASTTNANVGTMVTNGPVIDTFAQLNTPSLLGLARTAPYLHDGSAPTLKDRIMMGKETNLHGLTADLTDAEVDDLVVYLKSL